MPLYFYLISAIFLPNAKYVSWCVLFILLVYHSLQYYWSFSSVQSLSHVRLFATAWTAARQASLSITNSWSLPKLTSIESVMPSNHFILCRPLLLLPSIFPRIRVFSNELAFFHIRWPKYWSFSFSISPSNEHPGLISFRMDCLDLLTVQVSRVFSNTTVQKHQFFCTQLSLYTGVYPVRILSHTIIKT